MRRLFHWNGDRNRLHRRREPYRRLLRFESLEQKALLSGQQLTFSPDSASPPSSTWSTNQLVTNWIGPNGPSHWEPGDIAVFNATSAPLTVNLSGGVQVEGLTFTGSYATTIDAVLVSGAAIEAYGTNPIAVTANQSPFAAATIATPFSGTSGVALTVASTATSGSPTVTLDASVGSVTFASLSVAAGTLQIDNSVTTSSATATAGALDVEGMLNVSSSMTVSGNALLQGVSSGADIALAGNAALTYQSSAASSFAGTIAGPYAEIETQADPVSGDSTNALTLTGPVTIAGIQDAAGKLALNGSTTITNGDGSGTGLLVTNDAIITGSGPLDLESPDGSFNYESTAGTINSGATPLSIYSGPISGAGGISVGGTNPAAQAPMLGIASSLNTYTGGTYIETGGNSSDGTIQLERDTATGAPATLGAGGLVMGAHALLDLNGCSLTLTSLNDDSYVNSSHLSYAGITDNSTLAGTGEAGVTVLTLAFNGTSNEFSGSITDGSGAVGSHPQIRIVKTGEGTFEPDGDEITNGGFEIDAGTVMVGPRSGFTDAGGGLALTMNGGNLNLNGQAQDPGGGQAAVLLSQLDGSAGTITDDSSPLEYPTLLVVQMASAPQAPRPHPSIFGGTIADGPNGQPITLQLGGVDRAGAGTLVLTGDNTYSGGTIIFSGCLQVGDGVTTGSTIAGPVEVGTADGLIFDVPGGQTEDFTGQLVICTSTEDPIPGPENGAVGGLDVGSVLKTGPGTLELDPTGPNQVLRLDAGQRRRADPRQLQRAGGRHGVDHQQRQHNHLGPWRVADRRSQRSIAGDTSERHAERRRDYQQRRRG